MRAGIKKNLLRDLIYIQDNKPCKEQNIKGIFRAIVEPLLEKGEESLVLYRLRNRQNLDGLLKRLSYANATIKDFSQELDAFEDTEFLYVLSRSYGAAFIWDKKASDIEGQYGYYLVYNSKFLEDVFDAINHESMTDFSLYADRWHPERRENELMNRSIRKIVATIQDADDELIDEIEGDEEVEKEDLEKRLDFLNSKTRFVAHEIRNQLSICDIYSEILKKSDLETSTERNAVECIKKSVQIANTLLLDLKAINNITLRPCNLKEIIDNSIKLSQAYITDKEIKIEVNCEKNIVINADYDKFLSVLVNLFKNACEAIKEKGIIKFDCKSENDLSTISVINNGEAIPEDKQEKIFNSGFTTKSGGYGVGLYICKKSLEDMYGNLALVKSDENSTEFEISIGEI